MLQIFCVFTPRSQTVIQRALLPCCCCRCCCICCALSTACSLNCSLPHSLSLSVALMLCLRFVIVFVEKLANVLIRVARVRALSLSQPGVLSPTASLSHKLDSLNCLHLQVCLLSELLCSLAATTACSLNCLAYSTVLLSQLLVSLNCSHYVLLPLSLSLSLCLPLSLPSASLLLVRQTRGTAWAAAAVDNFALFRPFLGSCATTSGTARTQ